MTGDDKTVERFEAWGLLELMGHQRLAGRISDQTIGGVHFLRIDVPAVDDVPQYSRFVTQQAIYGMTVLAEGVARRLAASLRARPVAAYDLAPEPEAPALPAPVEVESDGPENPGFDMAGVECGKTYEGKVTRVLDFGALIEILPGVEGLLHISQIARHRVDNVADYLAEGQGVTVKVIETDERGRIKLSMKALLARVPAGHDDDGLPF